MRRDPEGIEVQYVHDYGDLGGARVLEIGVGDGRLARRYQDAVASIAGIDPKLDRVVEARRLHAGTDSAKVDFAAAMAEALPFAGNVFDGAIFAWSL